METEIGKNIGEFLVTYQGKFYCQNFFLHDNTYATLWKYSIFGFDLPIENTTYTIRKLCLTSIRNYLIFLHLKTKYCKCYALNIMYIKLHKLQWIRN